MGRERLWSVREPQWTQSPRPGSCPYPHGREMLSKCRQAVEKRQMTHRRAAGSCGRWALHLRALQEPWLLRAQWDRSASGGDWLLGDTLLYLLWLFFFTHFLLLYCQKYHFNKNPFSFRDVAWSYLIFHKNSTAKNTVYVKRGNIFFTYPFKVSFSFHCI